MVGGTGRTNKYKVIRLAAPPSVDMRDPSTGLPMQLDHHYGSLDDADVRMNDCESTSDKLGQC
jgi:hypothetical protein